MKKYILYKIARPFIKIFMIFTYKINIIGKENIPNEGKCILAGNHTNNLDALLLMSSTKRVIRFMAKKELHKGILGYLFKSAGTIPVDRSKKDEEAKNKAIDALNNNELVGIFPEGTINRKKEDLILPFKYGTVSFANKTSSPIVPFIISGEYKPFKKNIKIKFLKPYKLEDNNLENENIKLMNIIRSELEND